MTLWADGVSVTAGTSSRSVPSAIPRRSDSLSESDLEASVAGGKKGDVSPSGDEVCPVESCNDRTKTLKRSGRNSPVSTSFRIRLVQPRGVQDAPSVLTYCSRCSSPRYAASRITVPTFTQTADVWRTHAIVQSQVGRLVLEDFSELCDDCG